MGGTELVIDNHLIAYSGDQQLVASAWPPGGTQTALSNKIDRDGSSHLLPRFPPQRRSAPTFSEISRFSVIDLEMQSKQGKPVFAMQPMCVATEQCFSRSSTIFFEDLIQRSE